MSFSEYDVTSWSEAIANLLNSTSHDTSDERRAYEALANVWSGYGYQDAPPEVLRMLINATEVGYLAALNDLRDGRLDDEVALWRPDLVAE